MDNYVQNLVGSFIMNIEIADQSTWIRSNWYDSKFYLFSLGDGWRFPSREELDWLYPQIEKPLIIQDDLIGLNITWTDQASDSTATGYWQTFKSVQKVNKEVIGILIPVRSS